MKVAFDLDDTIWKVRISKKDQIPDFDLIQVVRWFYNNEDEVFFWSAGGVEYCETIIKRLGLDDYGKVVRKGSFKPDIAFDDAETNLATVDVRVNRYHDQEIARINGDLVSNCCAADFDPFGYEKEEGIYQERCLKCKKLCEPIYMSKRDIDNIRRLQTFE